MAGTGIDVGVGLGNLGHPAQAEGPKQQGHASVDVAATGRAPAAPSTRAAASTGASAAPTAGNAAANQVAPGAALGASARVGGGREQIADGTGIQSGSTTDPASAANAMRPIDPSVGGPSADAVQARSPLSQGPLPRQVTDALAASGYNTRSGSGQAADATISAQSGSDPQASQQTVGAPDPAGSPARGATASAPGDNARGSNGEGAEATANAPSGSGPQGSQQAAVAPDPAGSSARGAPSAPGDNARSSNGDGAEATANAPSGSGPQGSQQSAAAPNPAGSSGQGAQPSDRGPASSAPGDNGRGNNGEGAGAAGNAQSGPATQPSSSGPVNGGPESSASPSARSEGYGAEAGPNAPDGASGPAAAETALPGLPQAAGGAAAGSNAARAAAPLPGSLPSELGSVGAGDQSGPSPAVMPSEVAPVSGSPGAAFSGTGAGVSGTGIDREAVAGLAVSFGSSSTKTSPAPSAGGPAAAPPGGQTSSIAPIAAIPGSLASDRPVQAQIASANPEPTADAGAGALPPGTQVAQTTVLPGLTTNPAPAALGNSMAGMPAVRAGLSGGAWAYGFGPMPRATPQALLTPGIATAANGKGRRSVEDGMIAYTEQRPVLLDVAPAEPQAPSWRVDDTQTLVSVGNGGVASARERAASLYTALMEQGEGLGAVRAGEGFATWDGSPLWLSLAGIAKPGQHGILPNVAVPGRVQVLRTAAGEWLVEHTSPSSRPVRHASDSVDDDSLLLDVLYGVTTLGGDSDRSRRFERTLSALRFSFGLAPPARWRSAEAWASVARLCAVSAMQGDDALTRPAETALQAALSVVVSGLAPSPPRDALFVPPLSRAEFLKLALSGDGGQIVAGLKGLGRNVLDRLRRGVVDDLDRLDTLALAVCLGRLARTIPQSPPNAAAPPQRGVGPTARSDPARSLIGGTSR